MAGPCDQTGMTNEHWFTSSVAFSSIIHIIMIKLLLETNFWNWVSIITGLICFFMYYASVFILNYRWVSEFLQPELQGQFILIVTNAKALIALILVPFVALLPDLTWILFQKVFFPSLTDAVMLRQQKDPHYVFEGFDNVLIP